MRRIKMAIRHCKICGKEIEKHKQYCDECRRERGREKQREYNNRPDIKKRQKEYYNTPEVKERIKKYNKEYLNRPGVKERIKEYQKQHYREYTGIKTKYCEICGKEIESRRHYCDECRKVREKEAFYKHLNKPGIKERKKEYNKGYRNRPEVKEKSREYYRRKYWKNKAKVKPCEICGKEIESRRHYCDECRKVREKEKYRIYFSKPDVKEKRKEYYNRPDAKEKRRKRYIQSKKEKQITQSKML
jgi:predicted amidophosphoribosyltransferase